MTAARWCQPPSRWPVTGAKQRTCSSQPSGRSFRLDTSMSAARSRSNWLLPRLISSAAPLTGSSEVARYQTASVSAAVGFKAAGMGSSRTAWRLAPSNCRLAGLANGTGAASVVRSGAPPGVPR